MNEQERQSHSPQNDTETRHHYFVDEAGDLTLFGKRGQILVGRPGCSHVFMVGAVLIPNPTDVHEKLESLRSHLLNDPYFKNVPSMQPAENKTAVVFHAKDDLPEVRREVFRLLPGFGAKVQVAIRRKSVLAQQARFMWQSTGQKARANEIYDDLVKRLFRNLLHKADANRITMARRGKTARQEALEEAIAKARRNFAIAHGIESQSKTELFPAYPSQSAGLQLIDYYLWALQRFFERGEDRFFALLAKQYRLIMDLDDTRNRAYGEWYSDSNPLELKKIKPVTG